MNKQINIAHTYEHTHTRFSHDLFTYTWLIHGLSQSQSSALCQNQAPVIGEKPVPVKGLERTGRDFDPEPLGTRLLDLAGMTLSHVGGSSQAVEL